VCVYLSSKCGTAPRQKGHLHTHKRIMNQAFTIEYVIESHVSPATILGACCLLCKRGIVGPCTLCVFRVSAFHIQHTAYFTWATPMLLVSLLQRVSFVSCACVCWMGQWWGAVEYQVCTNTHKHTYTRTHKCVQVNSYIFLLRSCLGARPSEMLLFLAQPHPFSLFAARCPRSNDLENSLLGAANSFNPIRAA